MTDDRPDSLPSQPQAAPGSQSDPRDPRDPLRAIRAEMGKAVIGQDAVITGMIIALLCRGHVLLEGVPGTAKSLMVRSLAQALDVPHARIQFTPDLMPGDITGSTVYDAASSRFVLREGPVFTSLLLADEINRTPPKTQSALLEAMEEGQVSTDGQTRKLPDPFMVAATQNPVEYEGTYPLPEAQLDRFLLKLQVALPERDAEASIAAAHAAGFDPRDLSSVGVRPVASAADVIRAREAVRGTTVSESVIGYAVDIARATRTAPSVQLGVSPRGTIALLSASRAWAWLSGREYVTPDDVKTLAPAALRHRVQLRPEAEIEGIRADSVLSGVLNTVPVPR